MWDGDKVKLFVIMCLNFCKDEWRGGRRRIGLRRGLADTSEKSKRVLKEEKRFLQQLSTGLWRGIWA